MKKEEFLMEATLRLIAAKPQATMSEIADMAKELTEKVFNTANEMELEAETFWDKAIDKAPISTVISQIGKNRWDQIDSGLKQIQDALAKMESDDD